MINSDGGENFCDQAPAKNPSKSVLKDILPHFTTTRHTRNGQPAPAIAIIIINNRGPLVAKGTSQETVITIPTWLQHAQLRH